MRKSLAILGACLVVISTIGVAPVAGQASYPLDSTDDEVFEATSGDTNTVYGWERGVFPLRVGTSGADVSVPTPDEVFVESGGDRTALAKNQMLVFGPNDNIPLSFNAGQRANSAKLDEESIQLFAARITGGEGEGIPSTYSDAVDLLTQDNVNENATFEEISTQTLDSGGEDSTSYDPPQPGHYVFFAVTSDGNDGVNINNGELTIQEDVTVVGADATVVQEGNPSEVTVEDNQDPGESINVDVDVSNQLASSGVTHVVAVYNQPTYDDSTHTLIIDDSQLGTNFDIQQDSEFEHSIERVDGVADIDDGASVNGIELADGTISRSVGAGAMIDFIAENLSTAAPATTATDDTVLNASVVADVDTSGDTELTIETTDDWETGTYRYVYIGSLEDDETAVSAATGTIEVGGGGGNNNNNNNGGGGGGGDSDDDEDLGTPSGTTPVRVTTQVGADGTATADLASSTSVSQVQVSGLAEGGDVTVEEITDLPEGTPEPANPRVSTVDISAANPSPGSTATVRISVRASALPDDVNPSGLGVSHYINGQWRDLETTVVSEGDTIVVEAQTDSFSPFAVTYQQQTPTPEPDTATPEPDTATPEPDTATPEPDTPTTTPTSTPGFGVIVALTALIAAALLGVRREN